MEEVDLAQAAKGMPEKQLLAWWLFRRTAVRRRWVSERLGIGDESRVTQAIQRVREPADPGLATLKKKMEQADQKTAPP
jgi:hypothetical protein